MINSFRLTDSYSYKISQEADTYIITSPFIYDDGDPIVIFITKKNGQLLQLDDNGETATRLMFEGYDLDNKRTELLLHSLKQLYDINWDEATERLYCFSVDTTKELDKKIRQLIQAILQMQGLPASSKRYDFSAFKQAILHTLKEIQSDTKVEMRFDVPVDSNQQIKADAYFLTDTPIAIFVASSSERLSEAELAWYDAKIHKIPLRIFAVVESIDKIGKSKFARANYHTDKILTYQDMGKNFQEYIIEEVKQMNNSELTH